MKRNNFFTTLTLLLLLGGNIHVKGENSLKTKIEGHWNYPKNSVQTVYVDSEGEDVELLINGISFGHGKRDSGSLYKFDNVIFVPGSLTAVSYDKNGKELSRQTLVTAGTPAQLKMAVTENTEGFGANEADSAIVQFEVADFQGNRCGADNRPVTLEIAGPAEWIGSTPQEGISSAGRTIKAEKGTNSALIRTTKTPGEIKVTAKAKGLAPVTVCLNSTPVK